MSTNRRLVNFDQKTRRLNVPVIIGIVMLCLMGAMVLHGWSQTNSFVPAIQVLLGTAPGDAAGQVISQGDITLYIPPNATDKQGSFRIAEANPDVTLISNDTEWIRPKVVNVEFWQPNGVPLSNISFSEPVEICFGMSNEQWQAFLAQPEAFQVHHYQNDADPPYWEVLPQTSYAERQQLCGQTFELSAFALAIRVEAQVPVTGPTATATDAFSTLVATRTRVGPTQTRNPERGGAASGSTLGDGPGAPTSTATLRPVNTPRPANTATLRPTNTLRPPNTATVGPTNTPRPTNTRRPTRTPTIPPTATREPTNTPRPTLPPTQPPTATDEPPTVTPQPPPTPTDPPPPTATDIPPTDPPPPTDIPPTDPPPPTDVPPTDPPTEEPTLESGGGF